MKLMTMSIFISQLTRRDEMNVNRNGIAVATPKKIHPRKPLEYALDEVTFWRKEAGQIITIVVPKFSHLREALKSDGWRVQRGQTE